MPFEEEANGEPEELDLQWDVEQPHELEGDIVVRIRGGEAYVPAGFAALMKKFWGNLPTAVLTATDAEKQTVFIGRAPAKHPGAVKLRVSETFGTADFSFYRPLRKLKLEIPENRMLELDVKTAKAKGGDTVFKLEMNLARNKPRNLDEEEEGAGSNQKATATDKPKKGRKGKGGPAAAPSSQTAAGAQPLPPVDPESEDK